MSSSPPPASGNRVLDAWSPWRAVVVFGLVSLAADMVYEGMRSVAGPFLAQLGASALTVGLVTGAGEGVALVLRLVTGPWADRSQQHWRLTTVGYAMTAVSVPLLAVAPVVGAAGVALASVLILAERTGKAVRSPSKSALLARVAVTTGLGRGFGVHKALDQVGAFSGPLVVAAAAALTGALWPGFLVLAVPGAVSLLLLALLRRRVPSLSAGAVDEPVTATPASPGRGRLVHRWLVPASGADLPREFHLFSVAAALTTAGLMTFGVISYAMVATGVVTIAVVPLVYAMAMAVEAVGALATGQLFDRYGGRILVLVPPVVVLVPILAFAGHLWLVLVGVVAWGLATGVQDSSVKAYVADLVPSNRRATAYGVFAAVQGIGAVAGGALGGALALDHRTVLVACVAGMQLLAGLLILRTTRRTIQGG